MSKFFFPQISGLETKYDKKSKISKVRTVVKISKVRTVVKPVYPGQKRDVREILRNLIDYLGELGTRKH